MSDQRIDWAGLRQLILILIGIMGTFGGVFGAWVNFSNQQASTQASVDNIEKRIDRMETKLDRLFEREQK